MDDRDEAAGWAAPTPVSPDSGATPASSSPAPGSAPAWPAPPAPPHAAPGPPSAPTATATMPAAPTAASWQPGFMPLRPLGFGDLLGLPFRAMRYNRAVVVGGPLLLTLGATVLMVAAMWLLFTDPSLALMDPTSQADAISGSTIGVFIAAIVAALLADVFSSAVVAPGVARGALGERVRLAEAWRAVRPRIGSLLLLYLLASVTLAAGIVLAVVPVTIAAANESVSGIVLGLLFAAAVAIPVGGLVTLVGGIARPVIVLERRGAIDAIRRTTRLLKGRFWWSVLVVLVATVLIGLVSSVVNQVGGFGAMAVTLVAPDSVVVLGIAFALVLALSLVISYVLTYSYLGSLFALLLIDLRIRHEGFDLTLAEAAEARRA
ncbi:hypothetical protein [Demequina rhizosphaerae]|uniref:hypothetical protein n=1 Tax=Demequina rhizosphaerae TaxID=1638985 RepID=UPI0007851CA7|nr:hypothetical protein [Demequina rhizosphaerae]